MRGEQNQRFRRRLVSTPVDPRCAEKGGADHLGRTALKPPGTRESKCDELMDGFLHQQ
jgi:hypothetical protein